MTFEEFMKQLGFDELDDHTRLEDRVLYNAARSCWKNRQAQIEYLQHSIAIYLAAPKMLENASDSVDQGVAYD